MHYDDYLDAYIAEIAAAAFLGRSLRGLQYLRSGDDGPPHYRVGGTIRYRRRDLIEWMEQRKVDPAPDRTQAA